MAFVDSVYPTAITWLIWGGLFPLGSAVAFIVIAPHPARWAYEYWARQNSRLKAVQQKIEDQTPLTQEEANAIRRTSLAQQAELNKQLRELGDVNRELTAQIKLSSETIARLESENREQEKLTEKLNQQLAPALQTALNNSKPASELSDNSPSGLSQGLRTRQAYLSLT